MHNRKFLPTTCLRTQKSLKAIHGSKPPQQKFSRSLHSNAKMFLPLNIQMPKCQNHHKFLLTTGKLAKLDNYEHLRREILYPKSRQKYILS